jgi:hypothetical protein
MRNFLILLLLTVALPAHAIKIQQQGIVSQSDCSARGIANSVCLPLDNQIFVSALGLNESLDVAITNGAFAGAANSSQLVGNVAIFPSVSANALTVALLTSSGSSPSSGSPLTFYFRSTTATIGQYFPLTVTSNISIVVPATATLGQASAVATPTYIYAQALGGNVHLCVSSNPAIDEGTLQTSTTVNTSATARPALYCSTGGTGPVRLIGRFVSQQTTAGQWASAPTEVSVLPFVTPIAQNQTPLDVEFNSSTAACTVNGICASSGSSGSSGINRTALGTYNLVFSPSTYSLPPVCTCIAAPGEICTIQANATAAAFFFETQTSSTGAAVDASSWNITCTGFK